MALFRTRTSSQRSPEETRKNNKPVDTVEDLRKRAIQRLLGTALLVVAGIVIFSLLLDTQPRPIPTDIEISIPDKDKVSRLDPAATVAQTPASVPAPETSVSATPNATMPTQTPALPAKSTANIAVDASAVAAASTVASVANSGKVQASASLDAKEELMPTKAAAKLDAKTEKKPETKSTPKPSVADDGAKAKAILEGRTPTAAAPTTSKPSTPPNDAATRYIVQVGAFADLNKAREVRLKVERTGLKTYTHVAQTPEGARTRVRVGPFTTRAEADKAADKIKKLDLPAAILTL